MTQKKDGSKILGFRKQSKGILNVDRSSTICPIIIQIYSMKWKLARWKTLWVAKTWTWFSTSLNTTIKSNDWSTLQHVSTTTGKSLIISPYIRLGENTTNFKDLHIKDWLSKRLQSFKINSSRVYVIRHLKTVTVFRFKTNRFWVYKTQNFSS